MRRNIHIKQTDAYDCGAACLSGVAAWWGIDLPVGKARLECGCGKDGISIRGLLDGAQSIGLLAKALKAEGFSSMDLAEKAECLRHLSTAKGPVIAHTVSEEGMFHYVVILQTGKHRLKIMDPARERITRVNINEFAARWSGYIILLCSGDGKRREAEHRGKGKQLLSLMDFHRKEILLALAGSIVLAAIGICNSLLLKMLIDNILPSGNKMLLAAISGVLILMIPVSVFTGYVRDLYLLQCGVAIDSSLSIGFMRRVMKMPESFFKTCRKGEIESRLSDIYKIRVFVCEGIVSFCVCILALIAVYALMFTFYRNLALILGCCMPIYMALLFVADRYNRKMSRRVMKDAAAFENEVLDSIEGESAIRHFNLDISSLKFNSGFARLARSGFKAGKISALFSSLASGISQIIMGLVLVIGGAGVIYGRLSLGELVSFYTLGVFFISPMNSLVQFDSLMNEALVASERIYDITASFTPENDQNNLLKTSAVSGNCQDLVFHGVEFRYKGSPALFNELNCCFPKKSITLVTGPNGSGKSTVASLIMKDITPDKGKITYGGVDINFIFSTCWRELVSYVPQFSYLFNATIFDNVAMTLGKREGSIDMEEIKRVQAACSLAGMDQMLAKLEGGISASIGQGGCKLSAGQRQMVLVARALYKNPDIVIFDESSSNLDRNSRERFVELILKLKDMGKCVIAISHDSTLADICDNTIDLTGRS